MNLTDLAIPPRHCTVYNPASSTRCSPTIFVFFLSARLRLLTIRKTARLPPFTVSPPRGCEKLFSGRKLSSTTPSSLLKARVKRSCPPRVWTAAAVDEDVDATRPGYSTETSRVSGRRYSGAETVMGRTWCVARRSRSTVRTIYKTLVQVANLAMPSTSPVKTCFEADGANPQRSPLWHHPPATEVATYSRLPVALLMQLCLSAANRLPVLQDAEVRNKRISSISIWSTASLRAYVLI